jgi:hypothetical protein
MKLPLPEPGLVISCGYLWRHEYERGHEEGLKHRPSVIILATENAEGEKRVTVAPIAHSPPASPADGVEIPAKVKQHLGLEAARSWVVVREVNQFIWPGYDLRSIPGQPENCAYGFLPPVLFERIKTALLRHLQARVTPRD